MMLRMPQPGERWRLRVRRIEWQCPKCGGEFEISAQAQSDDGLVVTIVSLKYGPSITVRHDVETCCGEFQLPEGWVAYRNPTGIEMITPYTMFEPVDEAQP